MFRKLGLESMQVNLIEKPIKQYSESFSLFNPVFNIIQILNTRFFLMIESMRIIPFSFILCFAILGSITLSQQIVFVSSKMFDGDP